MLQNSYFRSTFRVAHLIKTIRYLCFGVLWICTLRAGAVNFIQEIPPGYCRSITAGTMFFYIKSSNKTAALLAILWDLSVLWNQSSIDILLCSLKLHNPTQVLPYRHVGIIRLHTKHKQIFPEVCTTSNYIYIGLRNTYSRPYLAWKKMTFWLF